MRKIQHLNFGWFFGLYNEENLSSTRGMEVVDIPHNVKDFPLNNFDEREYQMISLYRKEIVLESNKKAILHFDGVMTYAEVFIDDELIASHKGGYTPFSVDVTKYGPKFELLVKVDSNERSDIPPFGYVIDYLTYGGIYREVYIEYVEDTYIKNAFIETKINGEYEIDLDIVNYRNQELEVVFENDETKDVKVFDRFAGSSLTGHLDDVELWSLDNPNLYTCTIKVGEDIFTTKIGFREVRLTEEGFFLNNESIKLVGLNRHQSFPYVGYAMPRSAQVKDAHILKFELGCNVVRSSHYPPSKHFLDACDEIGLLVFNEIPGWQHIGDDDWKNVAIKNVEEMINRDFNHPSIFIWGVRINESKDDNEFYEKTNSLARNLDKTRPTGGVRFIQKSNLLEDVYTVNDFTHRGVNEGLMKPRKMVGKKAPYLVTEYNGHMFPTKRFDDESHRIEHVRRHLKVQDDSFKYSESAGAIGWCMFDYNTHKDFGSGDKICYHGVMDIFRVKKYAADVYASFQEEPVLTVCSNLNQGEYPAASAPPTTILTNCDYVKFYKNDQFIGKFYPNRKDYKYLPHPPIIIDDFIGDLIENNERFSRKDAKRLKDGLNAVVKYGQPNLPFKHKLATLYLIVKYKLTFEDLYQLFGKYVGNWGDVSISFKYEGYRNGELVKTVTKAAVYKTRLDIKVDSTTLIHRDTYDTTRVVVKLVDENDNLCDYAFDNLSLSVENGEIVGPSEVSLIGGTIGFWVRTKGLGEMKIMIDGHHLGKHGVELIVND